MRLTARVRSFEPDSPGLARMQPRRVARAVPAIGRLFASKRGDDLTSGLPHSLGVRVIAESPSAVSSSAAHPADREARATTRRRGSVEEFMWVEVSKYETKAST